MTKLIKNFAVVSVLALGAALTPVAAIHAATSVGSDLTQEIVAGTLSTSIRDAAGAEVAAPSFALGQTSVSTTQQTTTGTFGTNTQRITVDNPGGANGGWTLALAGTGTWTSGSNTYAYNGTAATGQLTVDPSTGVVTPVTGAATGVSTGTAAAFSGATPVTLMTATAASDDIWNGYLTGVGLSQTIPANTPAGNYTLDVTQTVTAS